MGAGGLKAKAEIMFDLRYPEKYHYIKQGWNYLAVGRAIIMSKGNMSQNAPKTHCDIYNKGVCL